MTIRLVIFDADKTLWSHPDISSLTLPFKPIDRDTMSDANGETFHLFNGVRMLLDKLQKRHIIITIASWNKPDPVEQALQLFGIKKFFKIVKAKFHPNKHLMIEDILSELVKQGIKLRPEEILYVDDRTLHLEQVRKHIGPLHFLQMWVDVAKPKDILKYIKKTQSL